ncbi:hypothetical protein [Acidithrix sp. C25]|uniref:hypothetical protein n=1 Tax=Acidithrix sp. C25 TaxID=1671482 RepID=UPI00191BAE25|nr:hypothetical protein [Acidithrix sp. C25]
MQLHNLARCNCTTWRGATAQPGAVQLHNLARCNCTTRHGATAQIGAIAETVITTPKLRRCYFQIAGHITRSARKVILHLEEHWHYKDKFLEALDRIRKFEIAIT